MANVIVIYHSYRGITSKLVEGLKKGVEKSGGQCETIQASDASPENVLQADTIVLASGQPFDTLSGPVKTFIEVCWNSKVKDQLAGKKYAVILNGSKDPKDVMAYLDTILPYFKLEKAAEGIACLAKDMDTNLKQCEELGEILGGK